MLAYAADRRPAGATASPRSLILIVAAHAVALAAVMSAKMESNPFRPDPPDVIFVPETPPPPPVPEPTVKPQPRDEVTSLVSNPKPIVTTASHDPIPLDTGPVIPPDFGNGTAVTPQPPIVNDPPHAVVRKAARFATPDNMVRPPYPESKRRLAEETSLRLALQVDARGRVTSVEAVGPADPAFLEAARKHILRNWRYQPATEDGGAVASRLTVTLQFKLDEE